MCFRTLNQSIEKTNDLSHGDETIPQRIRDLTIRERVNTVIEACARGKYKTLYYITIRNK